jgi:hypothetical protein
LPRDVAHDLGVESRERVDQCGDIDGRESARADVGEDIGSESERQRAREARTAAKKYRM